MENKDIRLVKLLLNVLVAVIVGTVLMIAVYCLPVEKMREHVLESNLIQYKETDTYYWAQGNVSTKLDGFTDAIMLNNAVYIGSESVIEDAMNNPYTVVKGQEQSIGLVKYLADNSIETSIVEYPRYWHGYLIWLKPLLLIMSYADIRIVFMFVQMFLTLLVSIELYNKSGYKGVIPFVFSLFCMNPISTAMCMQYACIYTITLLTAFMMLHFEWYTTIRCIYLFQWIGIFTAFFDFLTYPIVGLGINLILFLMISNSGLRDNIKKIAYATFSWGIGYAGMWIGKWIMASILTKNNVLKDGVNSVLIRSLGGSSAGGVDSAWSVITNNIEQLLSIPLMWIISILVIAIIGLLLLRIFRVKSDMVQLVSFAIVALYPFVWYSIVRDHSTVHSWMTYRNLVVTVFAISVMITNSIYRDRKTRFTLKRERAVS